MKIEECWVRKCGVNPPPITKCPPAPSPQSTSKKHCEYKWIEFKKQKPPTTDPVLVVMEDSLFWTTPMIGEYCKHGWSFRDKRKWRIVDLWGWDCDDYTYQFVDGKVKYWMPLPAMPKKKEII